MNDLQELKQRVPEPLWPMLESRREGWVKFLGTDSDGTVHSILLQYRGKNNYTLSVTYTGTYGIKPFMVGYKGLEHGFFELLKEALELIEQLFSKVETRAHWEDIANFGRFIDRHGVGCGMITRLVEAFTTLERLRDATPIDIEKVSGIGKKNAQFIADHFRK